MTPAQAIKMLDNQLARHGQTVTLHPTAAGVPGAGTTVKAFVRGFRPDELAGDMKQGDQMVVLSPSGLPSIPVQGSKVKIGTKSHNVQAPADVVRIADQVVRVNVVVRG